MKIHVPVILLLALIIQAAAEVGLYLVTKQNVAQVKEFSLHTTSASDGKIEFRITIPYDPKVQKVKIEYRLWSADMSKVLSERAISASQGEARGPWSATVAVGVDAIKDSTIEVFCVRNWPAETAYRIQLATFATDKAK